jgi:hypothetical protein
MVIAAMSYLAICMSPFFFAHYLAPATGCILALVLQCARHQRLWVWEGRPVGLFLVRAAVLVCLLMVPVQIVIAWDDLKSASKHPEMVREQVLSKLSSLPGPQLALVRYSPQHELLAPDWVDNGADIDSQKVVWARDMGPQQNEELLRYYKDRRAWLIEPDENPPRMSPYANP